MGDCTWKKVDGRWQCQAIKCTHWNEGGKCGIGKVSLTCDNNECIWNGEIAPSIYVCQTMDVHLDADGKCLGFKDKHQARWEKHVDAECDHYFNEKQTNKKTK